MATFLAGTDRRCHCSIPCWTGCSPDHQGLSLMEKLIWKWVRFVIGVIMFAGLMIVHVMMKEVPVFILAAPFALMGFDAKDLMNTLPGIKK